MNAVYEPRRGWAAFSMSWMTYGKKIQFKILLVNLFFQWILN